MMIKATKIFNNCALCHISWGYRKIKIVPTNMSLRSKWRNKKYPRTDIFQRHTHDNANKITEQVTVSSGLLTMIFCTAYLAINHVLPC